MVFIGLGSNLPGRFASSAQTLLAAVDALKVRGAAIHRLSELYASAPMPASDQPDFVNAVAMIEMPGDASSILRCLHEIEAFFDRQRSVPNAARTLDLDLLDCRGDISDSWPLLPHPRLHERLFVLKPLSDVAPSWRHPRTGQSIAHMIASIPPEQRIWPTTI